MKNLFFLILSTVLLLTSCIKNDDTDPVLGDCNFIDFKYYNNAPDYLGELSNEYILIGIDTIYSINEIQDFISTVNQFDQNYEYTIHSIERYKFREVPLKIIRPKTCEEITRIIADLEPNPIIAYAHYTMKTDNCQNAIWQPVGNLCVNSYGSNFYVKVFDENDLTDLHQMIADTKTELVKQNEFMSNWFELRATKISDGDALAMANYFYESELFEQSEPGISKYPVK